VDAGGYIFLFDGVRPIKGPNYMATQAHFTVTKDGKRVTELQPQKPYLQRLWNADDRSRD